VALTVEWEGVVLLKRAKNSALVKSGTWGSGEEVGMEKPRTGEANDKELVVETAPALQDVDDLFRTGGVDGGTGASVGVSVGVDAVNKVFLMSGFANGVAKSRCVVPSGG
jgi:hypothetical protein